MRSLEPAANVSWGMRRAVLLAAFLAVAVGACGNRIPAKPLATATITTAGASPTTASAGLDGVAVPGGPAGQSGPPGPAGPAGVSGYEVVEESKATPLEAQIGTTELSVSCPDGKRPIGGGVSAVVSPESAVGPVSNIGYVTASEPVGTSWRGRAGWFAVNVGLSQQLTLTVKAICAYS